MCCSSPAGKPYPPAASTQEVEVECGGEPAAGEMALSRRRGVQREPLLQREPLPPCALQRVPLRWRSWASPAVTLPVVLPLPLLLLLPPLLLLLLLLLLLAAGSAGLVAASLPLLGVRERAGSGSGWPWPAFV